MAAPPDRAGPHCRRRQYLRACRIVHKRLKQGLNENRSFDNLQISLLQPILKMADIGALGRNVGEVLGFFGNPIATDDWYARLPVFSAKGQHHRDRDLKTTSANLDNSATASIPIQFSVGVEAYYAGSPGPGAMGMSCEDHSGDRPHFRSPSAFGENEVTAGERVGHWERHHILTLTEGVVSQIRNDSQILEDLEVKE